MFIDKET